MAKEERAAGYEAARHARPQRIARLDLYPTAAVPNVHGLVSRRELLRRGSSLFRSSFWGELSQLCWFGFDSADRHVFRRYSTIPQHDRVGFVVGDALDHAAPIGQLAWALACDEFHPVPSIDHLQSYAQRNAAPSRIFWLGGVAHSLIRWALKIRERPEAVLFLRANLLFVAAKALARSERDKNEIR